MKKYILSIGLLFSLNSNTFTPLSKIIRQLSGPPIQDSVFEVSLQPLTALQQFVSDADTLLLVAHATALTLCAIYILKFGLRPGLRRLEEAFE